MRMNTPDVFETLDTQKEDARQPFQLFPRRRGDGTGDPTAELLTVVENKQKLGAKHLWSLPKVQSHLAKLHEDCIFSLLPLKCFPCRGFSSVRFHWSCSLFHFSPQTLLYIEYILFLKLK